MFPTSTDSSAGTPTGMIQVPDVVPIFPLPQTVLLPGEVLPLHVFEQRYRDMVRDALASHRVIGIVSLDDDETLDELGRPEVEHVGCLGFIGQHQELPDGRYLLWLVGLERFRIDEELELPARYRQARVTYTPTEESTAELAGIQPLRNELRSVLPNLVEVDEATRDQLLEQMQEVTDLQLLALGAQILEIGADRKQAILEAPSQAARFLMLFEDLYTHLDIHPDLDELDPSQLN